MDIVCLDLEGVLVPEIWIGVAEHTGIADLRLTTRDIPDYDELMQRRIAILDRHDLRLGVIREVIGRMAPLPGAAEFLHALRLDYQVLILSDTFYEFAAPLMRQLALPTLLCHRLVVSADDRIAGYRIRQPDPKRASVRALHDLRYRIVAAGDSYNDVAMLEEADAGILFRAPERVRTQFPQYPHVETYADLRAGIDAAAARFGRDGA